MRIVGVIRHRGRKTGRVYATPLGMRRLGDSFVMPLTFGNSAAWYRNVAASGSCEVTYMGRDYALTDPEVIDYETAAAAFPRYELLQFRFVGIARYLRMRIVQENKRFDAFVHKNTECSRHNALLRTIAGIVTALPEAA
jgi:deazaflavin-dependent oxidoreductase (nitroreductase family)